MQILRDEAQIASLKDPDLRALIQARAQSLLHDFDDMALHELVTFVVVEPGDSLRDLEGLVGFASLGFAPSPELVEEHAGYVELVFVLSDDGFGIEVFIPKGLTAFATFAAFLPSTPEKCKP
jgi:hypothetical protein